MRSVGLRALLCAALLYPAVASAAGVGFREVEADGLRAGIWYPSDAKPSPMDLGPFQVTYARDANPSAPAGEKFPIVIISHGRGGRYRNHHLTASHLAQNNFVVIAPRHQNDFRLSGGPIAAMRARVADIKNAAAMIAAHPQFAPLVNAKNINAIGYSLGGATLLTAAGVEFDLTVAERHCRTRHQDDAFFCGAVPWWTQVWHMFAAKLFPSKAKFAAQPILFSKIILAAPVGHVFAKETLATFSPDIFILRFARDENLRYPFHAEYLRMHLPARARYEIVDGHHYAFIAPFPPQLKNIPIASDPSGFDRAAFLDQVNKMILEFLQK